MNTPTPTTKAFRVDFVTADKQSGTITVEAIDWIDAKHLAEFYTGRVLVEAKARRVSYAPPIEQELGRLGL